MALVTPVELKQKGALVALLLFRMMRNVQMMRKVKCNRALWIMPLLVLFSDHAMARKTMGVYTEIESLTYSEIMSIEGFIDDFSGELLNGNTALTHNSAEMGVLYGDWRVGRLLRYDYDLAFSHDTAVLNYQIEHDQVLDSMAPRHIDLAAEHLRSEGIRVSRLFSVFPGFTVEMGVSWLRSKQFYSGSIQVDSNRGVVSDAAIEQIQQLAPEYQLRVENAKTPDDVIAIGNELLGVSGNIRTLVNTTQIQGNADYHYYRPALREDELDTFNDVALTDPSGEGFTMDVVMNWQLNAHWQFNLNVRDWYSRIVWDESPATTASITATQAALQALDVFDQFVEQDIVRRFSGQFFRPINSQNPDDPTAVVPDILAELQANNSTVSVRNERFVQKLTRQTRLQAQYSSDSWWAVSGHVEDYSTYTFWHLRGDFWRFLGVEWHPKVNAVGLELYHNLGKIRLVSDSSDFGSAQYLSLIAVLTWSF